MAASLNFLPEITGRFLSSALPIIVTGAGGWLGRAVLEMLDAALGEALAARVTVFASAPRAISLTSGRQIEAAAFGSLECAQAPPSLIFHCAFLTKGHAAQPDYVDINRRIARKLHGFIERNGACGLFIPSSGAVYGPDGQPAQDFSRNPYGALKHEDEVNFRARADRLGFPAAIMRIFNLAGPFINNPGGYALASIITDVLAGGPVTLRAAHPVWRSYAHVADVLNIAAAIMLRQLDVPVFDTAGDEEIEIGDLALRTGHLLTGKTVEIIRPDWRNGPADRYIGGIAAYRHAAGLAGVGLRTLDDGIVDTARFMKGLE